MRDEGPPRHPIDHLEIRATAHLEGYRGPMPSLLALLLTAQPSLVLPGLNPVNLAAGEGELYSELLAQELTRHGFRLQTARDVSAVLGLERQKQLMGCSETSCLGELASAIGADGLVLGDVGKLGQGYVVNVKVLLAKDGTAVALFSDQCAEGEVPGVLRRAARALSEQLSTLWPRQPPLEVSAPAPAPSLTARLDRRWALATGAVGLAGLVTGILCHAEAGAQWATLIETPSITSARAAVLRGQTDQAVGNAAVILGAAGLLATGLIYFLGGEPPVHPAAWLSPGGAGLAISGVLP